MSSNDNDMRATRITTTTLNTSTRIEGMDIHITREIRIKHKQKDTTNGRRKVRFADKTEKVFNDVCFQMYKSERATNQRELRRAKRAK